MTYPLRLISPRILHGLRKTYRRKKFAAEKIADIVKKLYLEGVNDCDPQKIERIEAIIDRFERKYVSSNDVKYRKVGLLVLAAIIHGVRGDQNLLNSLGVHLLEIIVPIVLNAFSDPDSEVQLEALFALHKITRAAKEHVLEHFNKIFYSLCNLLKGHEVRFPIHNEAKFLNQALKDIAHTSNKFKVNEEFISLVLDNLSVPSPEVRTIVLSWIDGIQFLPQIVYALLNILSDPDRETQEQAATYLSTLFNPEEASPVVPLVFEQLSSVLNGGKELKKLVVNLLTVFRTVPSFNDHASTIVHRLCEVLQPETVYRNFACELEKERDMDFAPGMVQMLNIILLASSEFKDLRHRLAEPEYGRDLFLVLYTSWCHSTMAAISLSLLGRAYTLASYMLHSLNEEDSCAEFLHHLNNLTVVPVYYELWLKKCDAFKELVTLMSPILKNYEDANQDLLLDQGLYTSHLNPSGLHIEPDDTTYTAGYIHLLHHFKIVQKTYRIYRKNKRQQS